MSFRGPSSAGPSAAAEGSAGVGGFFTEAMSRTPLLGGPMGGETNLRGSLFRAPAEKRGPEMPSGSGRRGARPVAPVAHPARGLDPALELVSDAAFQAPALARELRGVRGEALHLGHLDGHGMEALEPGRAAEREAARADAADQLRFVPDPDRLHLDADLEAVADPAGDLPRLGLFLGRVEHRHPPPVEADRALDDVEVQLQLENRRVGEKAGRVLELDPLDVVGGLPVGREPEEALRLLRRARLREDRGRRRDFGELGTILGFHDDALAWFDGDLARENERRLSVRRVGEAHPDVVAAGVRGGSEGAAGTAHTRPIVPEAIRARTARPREGPRRRPARPARPAVSRAPG